MDQQRTAEVLNRVRGHLEANDVAAALELIDSLMPADQADVVEELDAEQQEALLPHMDPEDAARLFEELEDYEAAELAGHIDPETLAHIVDEMPPDEAADLLGDLDPAQTHATLHEMRLANQVIPLLAYPDDTAGGLMTSEYLALPQHMTVDEALQAVRRWRPRRERPALLVVVDEKRRVVGTLDLFALIRAEPQTRLADLTGEQVVTIRARTDQEEAARLMVRYDLHTAPVVDDNYRILGVITLDDAAQVLEEEATEDILRGAGVMSRDRREQSRSLRLVRGSLWDAWRVRLPFLVITLAGGLLAGVVIDAFEEALETVVALAVFIPVVMDMGGNAGTQSSTIFSRALVLGQIDLSRFTRHLLHETAVGFSIGVALGAVAAVIAVAWQGIPQLGPVVGVSLALTMGLATMLGFLVPYILFRLGFDQAAGSDPIITTIKDITGLLIYFYLAYFFMGHLLP